LYCERRGRQHTEQSERRRYSTNSATLLDTVPQQVVPLVLRTTLDLLANVLYISDNVFPVLFVERGETSLVSLLLLLTRANGAGSLLAGASRGDGSVGNTVRSVGEEVSKEVERVREEVAELGGREENGEKGVKGLSGLLQFVL
jgi:hypothetical protein